MFHWISSNWETKYFRCLRDHILILTTSAIVSRSKTFVDLQTQFATSIMNLIPASILSDDVEPARCTATRLSIFSTGTLITPKHCLFLPHTINPSESKSCPAFVTFEIIPEIKKGSTPYFRDVSCIGSEIYFDARRYFWYFWLSII